MSSNAASLTFCDVTQSYAARGGGVRTFLAEKRRYLRERTDVRHCLIVPGPEDKLTTDGRFTTVEIASPRTPGSPNYRLLLRSCAVLKALRLMRPDVIECQDAYNLPWTALYYRARNRQAALVAGYHTDFPAVYVEKYLTPRAGGPAARAMRAFCYRYAANLYRRFDVFYTLTEMAATHFESLGLSGAHILTLGADADVFNPARRDDDLRARLGVAQGQPLLIYAGRIDRERRVRVVAEAFRKLPPGWGAGLVMLGDGNERESLMRECAGLKAHFPGFIDDREMLARYLASSDIYVSAMEDETFGVSVIEAQAACLPVVGVKAGAMIDRVPPALGRLGPRGDADAMAANVAAVWMDRLSSIGARARAHVLENFSWEKTFDTLFFEIYPRALWTAAPQRSVGALVPSDPSRMRAG